MGNKKSYVTCPVCHTSMFKGDKCSVCGYSENTDYRRYKTLALIEGEKSTILKSREYKEKIEKAKQEAWEKKQQEEMEKWKKRFIHQFEEQREEASRRAAEEEARRKAEEEARQKAAEEARRKAAEAARQKAAEEERRKAEEAARKKKLFGIAGACIAAVLVIVILMVNKNSNQTAPENETVIAESSTGDSEESTTEKDFSDVKKGDVIEFGKYEQDDNLNTEKEPIEWKVLDVQDGKALIQSVYGLDTVPYNDEAEDVTWATCTLRTWLNNDFYNTAFNDDDKSRIVETTVKAEDNPEYGIDAGADTEDNVFLLSISEAEGYYNTSDEARQCEATAYAKDGNNNADGTGAYVSDDNGNSPWWLRSPGSNSIDAASVHSNGSVVSDGFSVFFVDVVVRPALWINL